MYIYIYTHSQNTLYIHNISTLVAAKTPSVMADAAPGARRDVLLAFESNHDEGVGPNHVRPLREGLFQGATVKNVTENPGKMGKPWENYRKTHWEMGKSLENPLRKWESPTKTMGKPIGKWRSTIW